VSENVMLAHSRLSIIDISSAANQPMWDPSGRYCIVFNGEIFNFLELKSSRLTDAERSALRTQSDTEVLLSLFIKEGPACLDHLEGFFAFAVYDQSENSLFLARDRFGKKPLHIYRDGEKLLFASELKALLAFDIPRDVNFNAVYQYFQFNYIPQPQSILQSVSKLPAGSYLTVKNGEVKQTNYYKLKVRAESYQHYNYEEAQEQLVKLMDDAVRKRLISDVPLGAFLSGGIDSSVVVAMAARHKDGLKTFSIGYKDQPYFDETYYANLVAKRYKTEHTVFSLSTNDFLDHVFDVLDYIDEPFADSSAIPQFILSHYTRKHVTVALSGDGGDEVFGGYNKHAAELRVRKKSLLTSLVASAGPLWDKLPKGRNNKVVNLFRQLDRYSKGASIPNKERYWQWASFYSEGMINQLLLPSVKSKIDFQLYKESKEETLCEIDKDFNSVLLTDMKLVLAGDMLVKVDLMSMANSLEVRSPFLDHQLVEFAFGLPSSYKIDHRMKKKIVQDAFRDFLPSELYNRPKKGFEIPMLGWLRKELRELVENDLLSESFIEKQGVFDYSTIANLKKQLHSSNPGDTHAIIWALIVFQYWWKKYIYA
jgi:asparagine synthase (glutamine-hydrolysing)